MANQAKIIKTIGIAERFHAELVTKGLKKLEDGSCRFPDADRIDCIAFLLAALKNRTENLGDYLSDATLDLHFQLLKKIELSNFNLSKDPNYRDNDGKNDGGGGGNGNEMPNLQQVTTKGNSTTKGIAFVDPDGPRRVNINGKGIELSNGQFNVLIELLALDDDQVIQLPSESGILTLSVNGNMADENGNIVLPIPTEEDYLQNLQQVTDEGNVTNKDIILDKSKVTFLLETENKFAMAGGLAQGIDIGSDGSVYVLDRANNRVLKYTADLSSSEIIITDAGNGFFNPNNVAVDKLDRVYVTDYSNYRVLRFNPGQAIGTVVAGGNGIGAGLNQLNNARGIAFDSTNQMYILDSQNARVLKFTEGSLIGTVVYGGNGIGAGLNQLNGANSIEFDSKDNLYLSDTANYRILKIDLTTPMPRVSTIVAGGAGSGTGLNQIISVFDLDIDRNDVLYAADGHSTNRRVLKYTAGSTVGTVIAGQGTRITYSNGIYGFKITKDGKYVYTSSPNAFGDINRVYIGPDFVDLEARAGEMYRNGKRLLTELDILDTTPFARKTQIDDINDVRLPKKLDKDDSQQANRIIFVDPTTGKLIGQANFTFDKISGQIKVNSMTNNGNYKAIIGGGMLIETGVFTMNEYQSVLNMSAGRCALIVDGNGMHYRLFNNDLTDHPDTSKSFVWRNKGFVHFRCYTDVLAVNGQGQPTAWRQINEFQKFIRMPDLPPMTGSYEVVVRNNASKELQLVNKDLLSARRDVRDLPLIDNGDLSGIADYQEYRTSAGDTKYKLPVSTRTFKSAFKSAFK